MGRYFTIRRIPLSSLYRKTVRLGLQCGSCGEKFSIDYNPADWRGREGFCPLCREDQKLRPADIRMALEHSFRLAVRRIEAAENRVLHDILAFTIARAAIALEPILFVAVVHLYHQRVGHYLLNTNSFLWRLKDENRSEALLFAMPPNSHTESNHYLRTQVAKRFIFTSAAVPAFHMVNSDRLGVRQIAFANRERSQPLSHSVELCGATMEYAQWVWNYWEKDAASRDSFISFSEEDHKRARSWFEKMDIDPAAPYVCFLDRNAHYLNKKYPDSNWDVHHYHYMDVETFIPAMNWLADKGILCLRMGKEPGVALSLKRDGVIDYASEHHDDFLDIYLLSHCMFGVSGGTGIDILLLLQKKWYLLVNGVYQYVPTFIYNAPNFWKILKKFWSDEHQRFLSYQEIFAANIDYIYRGWELNGKARVVDNTPEEILAAVQEFYARFTGTWVPDKRDQQVKEYCDHVLADFYKGCDVSTTVRFCLSFLKQNPYFLKESGIDFSN